MLTTVEKLMAIDKTLTTEEQPLLEYFIKVATEKIEEYCNRKFEKADFQEFIEGPTFSYSFKNFPIISVDYNDFLRIDTEKGIIYFNSPVENIIINYTAGYEVDTIPYTLELAILMFYKTFVKNGKLGDFIMSNYSLGDESANYVAIEKLFNGSVPTVVANLISGLRGRV